MAWFYSVDGALRFPTAKGPQDWQAAPLSTWKGKGKVKVSQVLGWVSREALVDESAPPEECTAFFFDVAADGPVVTIRGFIHRDDADAVTALLDAAAELEASGKVLLDHVFDSDSGLRVELANGKMTVREGDVKMPRRVLQEIERESSTRAQRLGGKVASPAPKAKKKTTAKKKKTAKKKSTAKAKKKSTTKKSR